MTSSITVYPSWQELKLDESIDPQTTKTLIEQFRKEQATPIFYREFTSQSEYEKVAALCKGENTVTPFSFRSFFITTRTNNFKNFCEDFFLPTLIHGALKIDDLCLKIFLSVISIIIDVYTFPIRVITLIPRAIHNAAHPKETHLFYKYLLEQDIPADKLSADHVDVKFIVATESINMVRNEVQVDNIHRQIPLNFIELPKRDTVSISFSINEIDQISHEPSTATIEEMSDSESESKDKPLALPLV